MTMLFEKLIEKAYRGNLFIRNDNANGIFYYSAEDFPGLNARSYEFKGDADQPLRGYFYYYDNPIPGRLVVFDHGMGNGHRAYLREVERLAKAGFLVYTYDHTGCMSSGGESTNGFTQSLNDLDHCLTALKAEPSLTDRKIAVMGHSWGGFSTMNICALHPEITHVVSLSGFVSVEMILQQIMTGPMKGFRRRLFALEVHTNPDYVHFDARESLAQTNAKVLLIYSENDPTVHKAPHYDSLVAALSGKENIRFLLVQNKGHNPNFTEDAVVYKDTFFKEYTKAAKRKHLETPEQQKAFMTRYDWDRMTAQDEAVWQQIIEHLNSTDI